TKVLGAAVATVLNISPDHLDRYPDLAAYRSAKQRIFRGARHIVCNRDDPQSTPPDAIRAPCSSFGLGQPPGDGFGLVMDGDRQWLAWGSTLLVPVDEIGLRGRHNVANALAALALGRAAGLPMAAMVTALRSFTGLPHRCQQVLARAGITWIDDSK